MEKPHKATKASEARGASDRMQDLISLCKRRGFLFPSSELYGGLNACWDYGPLGVEFKNNVKQAWWNAMVRRPPIDRGRSLQTDCRRPDLQL